jgi:hypothetical protein
MSTPLEIVTKGCALANTQYADYPDLSTPINDLNDGYKDFIDDMKRLLKERRFWTYATEDSVVDQSEYNIETFDAGGQTFDITQIEEVMVKYSDSTYYTLLKRQDVKSLPKGEDWYADNQPKTDPFYNIRDNSVFVFPKTTEVVSQGIKFNVLYDPVELLIGDTEDAIKIPKRFHRILEQFICARVFQLQGKMQEYQIAEQKYTQMKHLAIKQMKGRDNGIVQNKDNN